MTLFGPVARDGRGSDSDNIGCGRGGSRVTVLAADDSSEGCGGDSIGCGGSQSGCLKETMHCFRNTVSHRCHS